MSMTEGTGTRRGDLLYSTWHRTKSITRYGLTPQQADALGMVNLDALLRCERWVEYARCCNEPLALIETAIGTHQTHKNATVTTRLAARCNPPIEAFCALVQPNESWTDIDAFKVKRLYPEPSRWFDMTPRQWAHKLMEIRERGHHAETCTAHRKQAA